MKKVIVVFMTVLMAVGLCFTALACNTVPSEEGLTVVPETAEESVAPAVDKDLNKSVIVMEMVEESGILLSAVADDTMAYSTVNGVEYTDVKDLLYAPGSTVVTASFKNGSGSVDKHLNWSVAWENPSEAVNGSSALDVNAYVSLVVSADTFSCRVNSKDGFSYSIILTVSSVEFPSISTTAKLISIKKPSDIYLLTVDGESDGKHKVYLDAVSAVAETCTYKVLYSTSIGMVQPDSVSCLGLFLYMAVVGNSSSVDVGSVFDNPQEENDCLYGFNVARKNSAYKIGYVLDSYNYAYFPVVDNGDCSFSCKLYLKGGFVNDPTGLYSSDLYTGIFSLLAKGNTGRSYFRMSSGSTGSGIALMQVNYGDTSIYYIVTLGQTKRAYFNFVDCFTE